ncbi:hypothetical protein CEK71_19030 [Methylovulum psychrotolerans]|uniref:Sulfatase-modifying factor enzyme-like domain-containing protein n=2 Tax=Methylovulum psychrotolerans TaxID=1704499 RepID=A0A1Z4C3C8_9GAMM|nr:hypothetical protein CEK71_19030 [Methylovulum psychrotolerans]
MFARCCLMAGLAVDHPVVAAWQQHWQAAMLDIQQWPQPEARASIARALALLKLDQRPGVGLNAQGWPDIDWVEVPGGAVVLGKKAQTFYVTPFCLARYPVTNAQFQAFLDDTDGYTNKHWWEGLDATPGTPEPPRWTEANQPRDSVSWFEAMAFCAWLSARLGYDITLPTEGQWQQAACSAQAGFAYPWGTADIRVKIGHSSYPKPHCRGHAKFNCNRLSFHPVDDINFYRHFPTRLVFDCRRLAEPPTPARQTGAA